MSRSLKCAIVFLYLMFCRGIISSDDFNIIRFEKSKDNRYSREKYVLLCVTDSIHDAIVWNGDFDQDESTNGYNKDEFPKNIPGLFYKERRIKNDEICNIDLNPASIECQFQFKVKDLDWIPTWSSEVPMGPVFDSRWEKFREHTRSRASTSEFEPVPSNSHGGSFLTFGKNGALVASIRGKMNAHFIMCADKNYDKSFCYWIIIGGWENNISVIRKCPNGIILRYDDNCKNFQSLLKHVPLSIHEWKTFVITWHGPTKTIKVYDPDKEILGYSDTDLENHNFSSYYLFFGNQQREFPVRIRFHEYNYALATKPGAQITTQTFVMNEARGDEICVDMMVGLCTSCQLDVRLVGSNNRELVKKIVSYSENSNVAEHGLPMWQHVRLTATKTDDKENPVMVIITTKLKNNQSQEYYWAVSDIQQCLPEGTVKQMMMIPVETNSSTWRDMICQRLSYDKQHIQAIGLKMDTTSAPGGLSSCKERYIGPKCSVSCRSFSDGFCQSATICDKNQCYCPQGYTSSDCSAKCAAVGRFGYNCREICNNCHRGQCNIYNGRCNAGCKKFGKFDHVPPFCIHRIKTPEVQIHQNGHSTLLIFFQKVFINSELNITYQVILKVNDKFEQHQKAERGVGLARSTYFAGFNNLTLGDKYRVLLSQHIQYREFDEIVQTTHDNVPSKEWTMCLWAGNFNTKPADKSLMIERIDPDTAHSCPDDHYSVKILPEQSLVEESRMIDSTNGQFPKLIKNLMPDTDYLILISGLDPSYRHRRQVRTLPTGQSIDIGLKIDFLSSTEVSFSWKPPANPDDIVNNYLATLVALSYVGCENHTSVNVKNITSDKLENTTQSFRFQKLIPYVNYKLLISVFRTGGIDNSSINFETKAAAIPTAIYRNLTFENRKITWSREVVNCTSVTGPILATRLFLSGVSENVKNFTDQYDTETFSYVLNGGTQHDVHGCEQYRVRIHPLRENRAKHNETAYKELIFINNPLAPSPPRVIYAIERENNGTYILNWTHPAIVDGPVTEFNIYIELISTTLTRELKTVDRIRVILYEIENHSEFYTSPVTLLSSTQYRIEIRSVTACAGFIAMGNPLGIVIKTPALFAWSDDQPSYIVNNGNLSITVHIPRHTHGTLTNKVHILLIGESSCGELLDSNNSLAKDIGLKNGEIARDVNIFSIPPPMILIGGYESDNVTSCALLLNRSYVVVVAVHDELDESMETRSLIWRSEPIRFVPRFRFEIWLVPLILVIIIIIILGIIIWWCRAKKRNRRRRGLNNRTDGVGYGGKLECKSPHPEVSLSPISEGRYVVSKSDTLVKLDKFQEYVKNAIASGKLETQFSWLSPSHMNAGLDASGLQHAYDNETAVILRGRSDDPYFKCLNAHYINGYKKHRAYIVLQGPQDTAVINFWRLVWQEQIEVICMLSDIIDEEQMKAEKYWPELGKSMNFGNISVENTSYAPFADYAFRVFKVKSTGDTRMVNHLHYTTWPDYGIPLYTQSVVSYLKRLFAIPSTPRPVLVHCNAGCGSTGTIILFDICHRRAIAEGVLDIFGATMEMKRQRPNLLDNKQQYIFLHVALVECLLSVSTAIPCDAQLRVKIQEHKDQLSLQQERLEQSVLHDKAVQFSTRAQLKLSAKNIAKNRYTDSLPLTRLYIPRYPSTDDDSSYIAGVYVDSARRRNSYIASQLPMPTTVSDFWRMIAAFKVELIIVLQQPDDEDPTCCEFLPQFDEEIQPLPFVNIKGKSIIDGKHFLQQRVVMSDESTESLHERLITVLSCKRWDRGGNNVPPSPESLVALWQTAEKVSRSDNPTVVLCHDGVSGCGLYLALSILLERMGLEHECDVCFAIRAIRRARPTFCRSKVQFGYLHNAALHYAAHFDAYSNFK